MVLLMASVLAGCGYEDAADPPRTAVAERSSLPPTLTKDREILDVEAGNYAELERLLGAAPGTIIFSDSGPINGPAAGFGKTATVMTVGFYTVTAACVGVPDARMVLNQDPRTGVKPLELIVECSAASSQVVELQPGYVSASVVRYDPASVPWSGAVAGIRVTATTEASNKPACFPLSCPDPGAPFSE
jgi:hypothetical protein